MKTFPKYPALYQVNTRVWLTYFVFGTDDDLAKAPQNYCRLKTTKESLVFALPGCASLAMPRFCIEGIQSEG